LKNLNLKLKENKMRKKKEKRVKQKNAGDSTNQDELPKIINEIKSISINIKSEMYRIGELLVRGKKIFGHGNFQKWITDNFEFSYQTALNFMNVYKCCLGRPYIVKTIKSSILYMIAAPDFPEDLREHIFERSRKLKKIKNKNLRSIYRRFKKKELDFDSSEIKNLFKKNKRRFADENYSKEIYDSMNKMNKLERTVLSLTSKIKWPVHPSTKRVELEDDESKRVNKILKKLVNAVQILRPELRDQNENPEEISLAA
jgi:hypothetical protein